MLIPAALLESDSVATLSTTEAEFLSRWFPLRIVEPPFRDTELVESLLWDRRFGSDPAHEWLRSALRSIAEGGESRPVAR